MADVEVGQVRREKPHGGRYSALPFVVWPSEHEQYKDAKGYEVKP